MVSGSLKSSQGQEDRVQTKRESWGQDPLQIYLETKSTVCDASLKVCFLYFLLVKYFHTNTFNSWVGIALFKMTHFNAYWSAHNEGGLFYGYVHFTSLHQRRGFCKKVCVSCFILIVPQFVFAVASFFYLSLMNPPSSVNFVFAPLLSLNQQLSSSFYVCLQIFFLLLCVDSTLFVSLVLFCLLLSVSVSLNPFSSLSQPPRSFLSPCSAVDLLISFSYCWQLFPPS